MSAELGTMGRKKRLCCCLAGFVAAGFLAAGCGDNNGNDNVPASPTPPVATPTPPGATPTPPVPTPTALPAVSEQVRSIITGKCAGCHTEPPADHAATYPESVYQCASCHVPFLPGHFTTGCTTCHGTPEVTHFNLRDDTDQTIFKAGVESDCIACHTGALNNNGRGKPPLVTDEEIGVAATRGTLRSWIQPGGFMAKYLTGTEVTTISNWIDSYASARTLPYDPYLDAVKVTTPPVIDGDASDSAWALANEHVINLTPSPPFTATDQVTMKAVYDDSNLYILAEWADSTLSMTRSGSWKWNGSGWAHPTAATDNDKQSEDRMSIIWNMSITDFRTTYGCAIKCHGNIPGSSCFTDQVGSRADIWHSKAARSLGTGSVSQVGVPAVSTSDDSYEVTAGDINMNGWLDDKHLVWYMDLADGYDTEDSGRRGDSGGSTYSHNRNSTKSAPKYMEAAPDDYIDAMTLRMDEVYQGLGNPIGSGGDGSVIVADPGDPLYAGDGAVDAAWANYVAVEAVVPERLLQDPAGSRADVVHSATWRDGVWTNEFRRALDTGDTAGDAIFDDLGREYEFSIAIFDNCGRGEIPPGHTTYGNGQYQILRFVP